MNTWTFWLSAFASILLSATSYGQQSTTTGYRVRVDSSGQLKCYGPSPDQSGDRTFVDNIYCVDSHEAAKSPAGIYLCYAKDAAGTVFGNPLSDAFCTAGYRAAATSAGIALCFNVDSNDRVYGLPVDDIYCRDSYSFMKTSQGQQCFNVDAYGKIYGVPVPSYYCD